VPPKAHGLERLALSYGPVGVLQKLFMRRADHKRTQSDDPVAMGKTFVSAQSPRNFQNSTMACELIPNAQEMRAQLTSQR
jgi:hypothetical protein